MSMLTRRALIKAAAAAPLLAASAGIVRGAGLDPASELKPMTGAARPIAPAERRARLAKAQGLLREHRQGALLVESGSTLEYFTGIRWWRSERLTAAIIPAHGEIAIVTPAFEEPSIREMLEVPGQVLSWNEDESPFQLIVQALRDLGIARATVAVEPTLRYFILDGVRRISGAYEFVSAEPLVRACRTIKSPGELALMQLASDVTLTAMRYVHAHLESGMSSAVIAALMNEATEALGGSPEFALVLLNEASAYPHGSKQAQSVHDGSIVLMDCGCTVQGYQSDISRTWVHGTPSARQRKVWDTVKHGQEIALATAKIGVPAGHIDDAVRRYYEAEGWGPGYRLPGLPHRTGHGIGLDGHESAYLVHGDATPLEPGMCFSDEPGLYIPGEFGVRLEDCWFMTASDPKLFSPLARSIDDPF